MECIFIELLAFSLISRTYRITNNTNCNNMLLSVAKNNQYEMIMSIKGMEVLDIIIFIIIKNYR